VKATVALVSAMFATDFCSVVGTAARPPRRCSHVTRKLKMNRWRVVSAASAIPPAPSVRQTRGDSTKSTPAPCAIVRGELDFPYQLFSPAMFGLVFGCVLKWQPEFRFSSRVGRAQACSMWIDSSPKLSRTKKTAWNRLVIAMNQGRQAKAAPAATTSMARAPRQQFG